MDNDDYMFFDLLNFSIHVLKNDKSVCDDDDDDNNNDNDDFQ